jgi:hypothetical protein
MNTDWIQTEILIYATVLAIVAVGLVYLIQSWRQKRQIALSKKQGTRRVSFEDGTQSPSRARLYISIFIVVFACAYLYFYWNQDPTTSIHHDSPDIDITPPIESMDASIFQEGGFETTPNIVENIQSTIEQAVPDAPQLEMELPYTVSPPVNDTMGAESMEKMSPVSGNSRKHTPKFRRGLVPF